jgi:hypothetical protein
MNQGYLESRGYDASPRLSDSTRASSIMLPIATVEGDK